jgi:hypothetical protein
MDISATSKPVSNLARSLDSLDNGSAPLSHQPQLFEKEVSGEVSQNKTPALWGWLSTNQPKERTT